MNQAIPPPSAGQAEQDAQRSRLAALARVLARTEGAPRLFETHISWVLVTERHAYKFKKALRLDFLDYSTLQARRHCCEEELRLNRRLAPELYLDVVALCGEAAQPRLAAADAAPAADTVFDYAVRMRAFPQQALWSTRLPAGQVGAGEIDQLAARLARFHAAAAAAPQGSDWGTAAALRRTAEQDLAEVAALLGAGPARASLQALSHWLEYCAPAPARFDERRVQGRVRECHGDLHCGNILTLDGVVEVFDCIEFCDRFRWIDVVNDLAFIVMDLRFHGRAELAARLLDRYLRDSGDYAGLAMLPYYQAMRALVRAKVCLLRAAGGGDDAARQAQLGQQYLAFAAAGTTPGRAALLITHGYAGSGKSRAAAQLAGALGAIRLCSDVERKRVRGVAPNASLAAPPGRGIYEPASRQATYARLLHLARLVLAAGLPVLVDATFLRRRQRASFAELAGGLRLPFFVLDVRAAPATLRRRLAARERAGGDTSDAGLAVLEQQLAQAEPLTPAECRSVLAFDSDAAEADGGADALAALAAQVARLATPR